MALQIFRFFACHGAVKIPVADVIAMTLLSRDVPTPGRRASPGEDVSDPVLIADADELPGITPGRWIGGIAVVSVKQSDDTPLITCH